MAGPKSDLITVSVPPESGSVQVLRAVTASVAARMNMPFDGIEDLRLAVDEACAWLLGLAREATSMTLRLRPMDDRLEAVVSIDAAGRAWPPPDPRSVSSSGRSSRRGPHECRRPLDRFDRP
jgi:serine/threonine-protein kinase RsbW